MITYKERNLSQIDFNTRRQLYQLTINSTSLMIEPLIKHLPRVAIIAYDDKVPVGWSLHIDSRNLSKGNKRRWLAYVAVNVNPVYRRQGIGRELINRLGEVLKSRFDFLVMMPHDPNSYMFFKKIGTKQWKNFPDDEAEDEFGRLIKPIKENIDNTDSTQAILTKDPVELHFTENGECSHIEIIMRLFPDEMGTLIDRFKDMGYEEDEDNSDASYAAANHISEKSGFARIVIENGTLYFNTFSHKPLTNNQLKFLKDYCIERGLELVHSMGMKKQYIDIDENKVMAEIKQLILEGVKEKALEDFIKKTIQGTEWQGKVFIAGGYVRDEFMGKDPKDLDLLVNSPNGGIEFAKWITKKVGAYRGGATEEDPGSNPVIFQRFGTAKFNLRDVVHNGIDLSDMDIEAVMPRKEQYTVGSRKPTVTGGELKDDVERRDFTVNSLLKDLSTGEILDLTGMGKADIKAGIIRTPLNPDKIFTDDPLRMLRAIRFAVKYNWKLPLFMIRGLKKNASQLKNISQERIRDELNKILITGSPSKGIKLLKITDLLQFVIPELVPAINMVQNIHHKHDVFQHTLDVLSKTEPILVQRLMALFHDIGKTVTKSVEPDTKGVHFYGHELAGEKIVVDVMNRLKYPKELIDAVKLGVRNHMRLKQAGDTGVHIKDKTLLKFRNEMGGQLENVLNLMHADNVAHSEASSMPNQITNIRQRLETLKNVPLRPKMPIDGFDLTLMGLKPGPLFKEIMNTVAEAWYEKPSLTKQEALEIAKRVAKI